MLPVTSFLMSRLVTWHNQRLVQCFPTLPNSTSESGKSTSSWSTVVMVGCSLLNVMNRTTIDHHPQPSLTSEPSATIIDHHSSTIISHHHSSTQPVLSRWTDRELQRAMGPHPASWIQISEGWFASVGMKTWSLWPILVGVFRLWQATADCSLR